MALLLLLAVFIAGILGFKYISDYAWIDAVYMTVITITTVGFKEVHPLDPFDKKFIIDSFVQSFFLDIFCKS